ncbi:hypothetical protein C480_13501 [Natrialba aegyptia DSM 13077]|uniref:Uncharacterized protein n=2 Tax=Natrialba aegyptia TaxID=129789 RepID=M0B2U2_9EURY|nr:hypothetical protein C480_13501 [Natrialba aegyptia DSM 13077]
MDEARRIGKEEGLDARDKYLDSFGFPHTEGKVELPNDGEIEGIQSETTRSDSEGIAQNIEASNQEKQPGYCVDPRDCGEDANIDVEFQLTYNPMGEVFDFTFYMKYRYGWESSTTNHPDDPDDYPLLWVSSPGFDQYIGPRRPTDVLSLAWNDPDRLEPYMPPWKGCESIPCAIVEEEPYTKFVSGSYSGEGVGIEIDGYHMAYDNGPTGSEETDWTPPATTGIMLEKGPEFVDHTRLSAIFTYAWKGTHTSPDISIGFPPSFNISDDSERFESYNRFQHTRGEDDTERDTFEVRVDEVL